MSDIAQRDRKQTKQARLHELLSELQQLLKSETIRTPTAHRCRSLVDEAITLGELDSRTSLHNPEDILSNREWEIAQAISGGLSNNAIAESLFISVNTVRFHVGNILRKLDASNRSEAAAIVGRHCQCP